MASRQRNARQSWMGQFAAAVVEANVEAAGRIDWATATYLMSQGCSPAIAVRLYLNPSQPMPAVRS
jgi:hypothetical protein